MEGGGRRVVVGGRAVGGGIDPDCRNDDDDAAGGRLLAAFAVPADGGRQLPIPAFSEKSVVECAMDRVDAASAVWEATIGVLLLLLVSRDSGSFSS